MGVYGVLESCESVIVVCEYKGRVIDVLWECYSGLSVFR